MDEKRLPAIVKPLLGWYAAQARALPWRDEPSPYRVWISEIMLQQTRVEAVKPYFERFMQVLPTVQDLAGVDEQQLFKLWEGLGYYNRARNLKKAASLVMENYNGQLPASYEELKKLPGIGEYTAGAIASIAYGVQVPAVDGNVFRVVARIMACQEDISKRETRKWITDRVKDILPETGCGDFNQALMELGATVCLPGAVPKCMLCPIRSFCAGYARGNAHLLPVKAEKKPRRVEARTVFVIVWEDKIAIRRRQQEGLLAGLWELPNVKGLLTPEQGDQVLRDWGIAFSSIEPLPPGRHVFTHIEWQMTGYLVHATLCRGHDDLIWVSRPELAEQFSLPTAFKGYARYFQDDDAGLFA